MNKVCIFGGGGYIGNVLCRLFLSKGYKVRCVDNFHKGQCDALLSIASDPHFEFMYGDVTVLESCQQAIKGCDMIVNLAGIVGFPACKRQPGLSHLVNVDGPKNVLEARQLDSIQKPLFFASTGSVYGKLEEICTEESPTNPQSIYGQHKLISERVVAQAPNALAYRFATCFGVSPCMRVNLLINDLVYQAINNRCLTIFEADAQRTFIHIDDFCESIIFGLENIDSFRYQVYNCGDNKLNWSKRKVAEYIADKTGCIVNYNDFNKDPDARDYEVSYEKINAEGFKCLRSIEEGIDELIKVTPLLKIRHNYE